MISIFEVNETNKMIEQENLDVRTITLGISLLDCIDSDLEKLNEKIYNKITTYACGIERIRSSSAGVIPLLTRAVYPPIKFTPTCFAALSRVLAIVTKSSVVLHAAQYGIPIVNKRISVTPIGLVGGAACKTTDDFVINFFV